MPYILPYQVDSHRKAAAATASGKFKDEIIPVKTMVRVLVLFLLSQFRGSLRLMSVMLSFAIILFFSRKIVDPKSGDEKPVTIAVDDGIRPSTTVADLGKLKAVFKKDGTTTAGK